MLNPQPSIFLKNLKILSQYKNIMSSWHHFNNIHQSEFSALLAFLVLVFLSVCHFYENMTFDTIWPGRLHGMFLLSMIELSWLRWEKLMWSGIRQLSSSRSIKETLWLHWYFLCYMRILTLNWQNIFSEQYLNNPQDE